MRHQDHGIRAAASALLVAVAIGSGGMGGMTSALAADPAMVQLAGTVTGAGDIPLAGIHLTITEADAADGGIAAAQVVTGAGGTFSADIYPWGTAETPATLTIAADQELEIVGDTCSQVWRVSINETIGVAFADAAPEPRTVKAAQTLLGEVCGTTATPPPNRAGGGGAHLTPPPTDTVAGSPPAQPDRLGPALTVGFLVGLAGAAAFLLLRPGARRRD